MISILMGENMIQLLLGGIALYTLYENRKSIKKMKEKSKKKVRIAEPYQNIQIEYKEETQEETQEEMQEETQESVEMLYNKRRKKYGDKRYRRYFWVLNVIEGEREYFKISIGRLIYEGFFNDIMECENYGCNIEDLKNYFNNSDDDTLIGFYATIINDSGMFSDVEVEIDMEKLGPDNPKTSYKPPKIWMNIRYGESSDFALFILQEFSSTTYN